MRADNVCFFHDRNGFAKIQKEKKQQVGSVTSSDTPKTYSVDAGKKERKKKKQRKKVQLIF